MSKKLTDYDKKVIAFLKSKRAFAKFKRNVKEQNERRGNYVLLSAFMWAESPEGAGYWGELESELKGVINNDN